MATPRNLVKHKTVREALRYVEDNPEWPDKPTNEMPVWELIARALYEHANNPDASVVGSMARATRAQRIILYRTTGTRRTGTHPAQAGDRRIEFADLTAGMLPKPEPEGIPDEEDETDE